MPPPAFSPSQALASSSSRIFPRASSAGTETAMSRMGSARTVPSGKRISWPESGS